MIELDIYQVISNIRESLDRPPLTDFHEEWTAIQQQVALPRLPVEIFADQISRHMVQLNVSSEQVLTEVQQIRFNRTHQHELRHVAVMGT